MLRTLRLMSREQVAEAVKLTRDAIAKFENGERKPKVETLEDLCKALHCEPQDLYRPEDLDGITLGGEQVRQTIDLSIEHNHKVPSVQDPGQCPACDRYLIRPA